MSAEDLENAKEIGGLVSDVKYIRETIDMMREDTKLKRKEYDDRLCKVRYVYVYWKLSGRFGRLAS